MAGDVTAGGESDFKTAPFWELADLVGPTGAWLGRAGSELHHHDAGLAAALSAFLGHESPRPRVLDMGCGLGEYVKAVRARGVECHGFDGHAETATLTDGLCYSADFEDEELPQRIAAEGYDWGLCLEVFEHVPVHLEGNLVRCMLAAAGRGLVVSVATPGQGGLGHVNERPHEYVIGLLEGQGLVLDVITTMKLRQYCQLPWFQANTLVFRRWRGGPRAWPEEEAPRCAGCEKRGCKFCCAHCQEVWYCSTQCQCAAFREHRASCSAQRPVAQPAPESSRVPSGPAGGAAPGGEAAFDAAVSLGPNCLAAYRIAKAGLKRRSFPFDVAMSGSDGWPAHEEACWQAPCGLRLPIECLWREPPFEGYVADMAPMPHLRAVGNCGFEGSEGEGFLPSAHIHDDPREPATAEAYRRRALRFRRLLASGYRVLFLYTLRLRDLRDGGHVANVAGGLLSEVGRLRALLARSWPSLEYRLVVAVLGELHEEVPVAERLEMRIALEQLAEEGGGRVAVERLRDAPAGPDPMDGFWGDDAAWAELFRRHPVAPRDFAEGCFAEATKAGAAKGARPQARGSRPAKFERFVEALGAISPERPGAADGAGAGDSGAASAGAA